MEMLEVDVNGEEIFLVDQGIITSTSNLLKSLVTKKSNTECFRIILSDFPGGPASFELYSRFCYSNGGMLITPTNTCSLSFAARFLEMTEESSSSNLIEKTEKSLQGITYWSWTDIVNALKQCHDCFSVADSSGILDKIVESLVQRINSGTDTSPTSSSPESSAFRFSFDTRSTFSTKHGSSRAWWFEDLAVFDPDVIEKIAKRMVFQKIDHVLISRFMFYYLRNRISAGSVDKLKITELVVDILYRLDLGSISCRGLFSVLRASTPLNISELSQDRLESMIGRRIDQATLDNLLIPSSNGTTDSLYDVNIVIRFLKHFVENGDQLSIPQLRRVGNLMDLYLAEVAPDSTLKPSKFFALITALPDAARESYDAIYRSIDMYLEVHSSLSDEERMGICCAINCDKLSTDSFQHLAMNLKFPSRTAIQAIVSQHYRLKSILNETKTMSESFSRRKESKVEDCKQIVLYAKRVDLSSENDRMRSHLKGMQCRVIELEKICRKMQEQMERLMKQRISSSPNGSRSLPRLCS